MRMLKRGCHDECSDAVADGGTPSVSIMARSMTEKANKYTRDGETRSFPWNRGRGGGLFPF